MISRWLKIKRDKKYIEHLLLNNKSYKSHQISSSRLQATIQMAHSGARKMYGHLRGDNWEIATFSAVEQRDIGELLHSSSYPLSVIMIKLKVDVPHLYFDNRKNNAIYMADLPTALDNGRMVYYEGYVSERYSLYAPKGYHIDALTIGAPDLLEELFNLSEEMDVEFIGTQLYLSASRRLTMLHLHKTVLPQAHKIADELNDNMSTYIDERTKGRGIHSKGKRLTKK